MRSFYTATCTMLQLTQSNLNINHMITSDPAGSSQLGYGTWESEKEISYVANIQGGGFMDFLLNHKCFNMTNS